uniref:Uncharacterized protein n=1 Tax=Podoviridae sp. ct8Lf7 TaxID=2827723 RepID=A0A8S5RZX4_9CAUD|nr:MAG TPA: hypothetical protein [Podoviridae sp. ct8Lf7]
MSSVIISTSNQFISLADVIKYTTLQREILIYKC